MSRGMDMRRCTVKGCDNKHQARGYCWKHYMRLSRRGKLPERIFRGIVLQSPEYITWTNMKTRCYNKKTDIYKYYGGRGIKVCDRWKYSFDNFLEDMGKRPTNKHQIDRIENDESYEPDNCEWVLRIINNRHKSDTKLSMGKAREIRNLYGKSNIGKKELADRYGVSIMHIHYIVNNRRWKELEV